MTDDTDRIGPLVLAKLGHDLRALLDDTMAASLPPRLQALADALSGYAEWRDVPRAERQG